MSSSLCHCICMTMVCKTQIIWQCCIVSPWPWRRTLAELATLDTPDTLEHQHQPHTSNQSCLLNHWSWWSEWSIIIAMHCFLNESLRIELCWRLWIYENDHHNFTGCLTVISDSLEPVTLALRMILQTCQILTNMTSLQQSLQLSSIVLTECLQCEIVL